MTESATEAEPEPIRYTVRLSFRASWEAAESMLRLAEMTDDEKTALEWLIGLQAAAGTLAEQPRRYPVLERESRLLGFPTRRLVYRRTAGSAAYHALYRVDDEGEDGPRVTVFHIRHASRRPLTTIEARALRQETD